DGGDAVVRREGEKAPRELLALGNVDRADAGSHRALFEHDGTLPAVGRRPVIELDRRVAAPAARCLFLSSLNGALHEMRRVCAMQERKTAPWNCSTAPMKVLRGHRQQTEGVGEA